MSAQPIELDSRLYRIVPMRPSHLELVMDIERRAYEFPWTDGIFRDCLNVGYSAWVIVNTIDELMGYALMSMAVGEAHVLNLCVNPDYQQRGVGAVLLKHLIDIAKAADTQLMLLEVRTSNTSAIRLYDRHGFRELGLRRGYYPARKGREDALVLALDLVPGGGMAG